MTVAQPARPVTGPARVGGALRQAGRATLHLFVAAALAFGLYLFVTVLLITAIATACVVGAWLLPETVRARTTVPGPGRRTRGGLSAVPERVRSDAR